MDKLMNRSTKEHKKIEFFFNLQNTNGNREIKKMPITHQISNNRRTYFQSQIALLKIYT